MLKDSELKSLAGASAYGRGKDYHAQGRVRLTRMVRNAIEGEAYGTETYALWLKREAGEWQWACACPAADAGSFCKHLVAAALAWRSGEREPQVVNAHDELLDFLRAQPAERLAGWLKELAEEDRDTEKRLRLYRAAEDPAELKRAVGKMLNASGFLDYRGSIAYARKLDVAIVQIEKLLARDALACLGLCEYALGRLFKLYERADDSAGAIGERLARVADLHARAFARAQPEGKAFARALHGFLRLDHWDLLPLAAYWPAMDKAGHDEYTRLVLVDLERLPINPGLDDADGDSFYVCAAAENLARFSGDFDLLQRVLRRDLSDPYKHLRVAQSLAEFGRDREALQWLENAVKRFPEDERLHGALALALSKSGLEEEALQQRWAVFCMSPCEENWMALRAHAGADWPQWREQALHEVAQHERPGAAEGRVRLLLNDGDVNAALTLAESETVHPETLIALARKLEKQAPLKAGSLYLRCARVETPQVELGNYARFVDLAVRIARLLPEEEWKPWLTDIKQNFQRKRKLMAMLSERGL